MVRQCESIHLLISSESRMDCRGRKCIRLSNVCLFILLRGHFSIWGRRIEFSISTLSGLVFFYLNLFIIRVFSCNITPPQFRSSYICRCPPTSIFHVVISTSSSVFLSTMPNHLGLASLICSTYMEGDFSVH